MSQPPLGRHTGSPSRRTRSTAVSIGRVNSPSAVSGRLARNARIRASVASRSGSGMTSIPNEGIIVMGDPEGNEFCLD